MVQDDVLALVVDAQSAQHQQESIAQGHVNRATARSVHLGKTEGDEE
jgi:hypothetical protein